MESDKNKVWWGKIENDKPVRKHGLMKIGFYITIGVVAIAVIVALIIININKKADDGTDVEVSVEVNDDEEIVALDNTELSAGTVTTTIGGKSITYSGAYVVDGINATIGSGVYESAADDQVVFLVINGGSLKIQGDVKINKTGSSNFSGRGDNYSFYGINSAIAVVGSGSSVTINGATITSDVSGANAVVATNGGGAVVKNTTITTTKDNSRGLHATYGGAIQAEKTTISTQGGSSATLATDRGAGVVNASDMTLSTAGAGSPLIYSTGEITVSNSTGTATGAQIAVVEGKNTIALYNCEFAANGVGNRNSVDNAGVMIYQSMSGDAAVGAGKFTAKDSKLNVLSTSSVYNAAPFFFVTNTTATIELDNVEIGFSDVEYFISVLGTSEWGKSGSNGGTVTITASRLTATNTKVEVDDISVVSGL